MSEIKNKGFNPLYTTTDVPEGYIAGLGRDVPHPRIAHLYQGTFADPGNPMCARGWNRDEGTSYSIWRGNIGDGGICKICMRRAQKGLDGVEARENETSQSFDDWWVELKRLLVKDYGFAVNKPDSHYGGADSWRTYFECDFTPGEAIQEDFSYA
jgi:hypothetical protein